MTSSFIFTDGSVQQTFDTVFLLRSDYSSATSVGTSNFRISTGKDLEDYFLKRSETSFISGIAASRTILTNFKKSSTDLGSSLFYKGDLLDSYEAILTNNANAFPKLFGWGESSYAGNGGGVSRINPGILSGMSSIKFKKIDTCHRHSAAITTGGALYTWGTNGYSELGRTGSTTSPLQLGSATTWKDIACGKDFTVAVKTDGTLWSWGRNAGGQLGLGDYNNRSTPTQVGISTAWDTVAAASGTHAAAIKTNGTLYAWGSNGYGQLGAEDFNTKNTPNQMRKLVSGSGTVGSTSWTQVACGYSFTIAIDANGNIWSTGFNASGQLGLGFFNNSRYLLNQIESGSDWKQVSCGKTHALAVKTDGRIYGWGNNSSGQLAIGSSGNATSTPTQEYYSRKNWNRVDCGGYSTAAIGNDGFYYFAGYNHQFQWGSNSSTSNQTTLNRGGTGSDSNYGTDSNAGTANWKRVAIGYGHVVAIIGTSTTTGLLGL